MPQQLSGLIVTFLLTSFMAVLDGNALLAKDGCPEALAPYIYRNSPEAFQLYTQFLSAYQARDLQKASELGQKILPIVESVGDHALLACLYPQLNAIYARQEKLELAINCALNYCALPRSAIDSMELIKQQSFLSEAYSRIDLWKEAYQYHLEAQENAERYQDPSLQATVAFRGGSVYFGQGELEDALHYYKKALQYSQIANDTTKWNLTYGALTAVAIGLKDLPQARIWNKDQLATAQSPYERAQAVYNRGSIALLANQEELAKYFFQESLQLFEQSKHYTSAAEVRHKLADLLWTEEQTQKAIQLLLINSQHPKLHYQPWVAKADRQLAEYYEQNGQAAKALFYIKRLFEDQEERVERTPNARELEALKVKYLLANKEAEVEKYELQQHLFLVALLSGLVIVTVLALAFWASRRAHLTTAHQKQRIEAQNNQLLAYNERLKNFNRVVSHDLKQPLRTARGLLGLIQRRHQKDLPEAALTDFNLVEAAVARGYSLVEALLSLARLERVEPEDFNWIKSSDPLREAQYQLQQAIDESNAQIHISPKLDQWPDMFALPDYLTQLWQNLLANACKFVPVGATPDIEITYQPEKHYHHFLISDRGIGVPPPEEADVFAMFNRSVKHSQYEGSGIGLATCKRIVELHGGRIGYYPNGEQGTVFFFTIPKKPRHQLGMAQGNAPDRLEPSL